MWNECKKCTVLYGGDVPGFDWYHTWNCGVHAYMLVRHFFVKGVEKLGPNRCISAYGECECEMSAKSALFCMVGMCLGSIGTTLGTVGCMYICWSGTFLWKGSRNFRKKSVYKCLWLVRMWNECKKCTVLYGGDVPGFDWYHTWNCGVHAYMLVRHFFVKGVEK